MKTSNLRKTVKKRRTQQNFDYPVYEGNDLGVTVSNGMTVFRLWAPSADKVVLRIYKTGDGSKARRRLEMIASVSGTWIMELQEDLQGFYYTYQVHSAGKYLPETIDPYAKSCGVNGKRGMILDLKKTDPIGFDLDKGPVCQNPVDIIVTETSVCDATIDPSAASLFPGKFLGLAEKGVARDHLEELGITHVQLMPFYDFASVDEEKTEDPDNNWGYDPLNFNIPEGSYSTDPYHGEVRIRECKEMIRALHNHGIGVIMDVVYNHVYDIGSNCLQRTVPGYFFRQYFDEKTGKWNWSNGSGCGSEIASERLMVRKYIIDSLCYWVREYHVDGFRFDLMGVLDIETMNQAAKELRKIKPDIILYGEGWTGGIAAYPEEKRAVKDNITRLDGYGIFSDDIRDHIKGSVFDGCAKGFATGAKDKENDIRYVIAAAVAHRQVDSGKYYFSGYKHWAKEPRQVINYVSCHDNLTLWDKLTISCPEKTEQDRLRLNCLCAAIVFTAQGIPFFLEGEEFARSKPMPDGHLSGNSYNLPASTNGLRYDRTEKYPELFRFYQGLIAFRKKHPALRLRTGEEIAERLSFLEILPKGMVGFVVTTEEEELLICYNPLEEDKEIELSDGGEWLIQLRGMEAGIKTLDRVNNKIVVPRLSAIGAVKNEK